MTRVVLTGAGMAGGPAASPLGPWLFDGRQASLRQADPLSRLAVRAASRALDEAGLGRGDDAEDEMGLAVGSGFGCLASNVEYLEVILARGTRRGNPIVFQNTVPNAAAGYVSIAAGIGGPNATFSSGKGAGAEAVLFGWDLISDARLSVALVGSADQVSAAAVQALTLSEGVSACGVGRPYDRRRDGAVPSDGACFLVLESRDRAHRRGARVLAEILAVGHAGGRRPLADAIRSALDQAGLVPEDVDLVVSGANGSPSSDRAEAAALVEALGERAAGVPVTCPKSRTGETVGGSGPVGMMVAAAALESGIAPATLNCEQPDAEFGLDIVTDAPRPVPARVALVPVLGDDGTAHAILLGRGER